MNYELLADVAQIIMGQSPPSSTYNTVGEGMPFYQGKADFGDMYPTPRVYCTQPSRIAEPGDILISVRAPVGPTNISRERSAIGRGISAIRVGKSLDRDFLLYFLRFYEPELAKAGTGSTFAAIAREDLETIRLPLPPLAEQKRIASLLARADRLRQLRRAANALADSLLQSVFLEMFGDIETNSKGWDFYELGELDLFISDGNYSSKYPRADEFVSKGIPFIRANNLKNHTVVWDDMRYITPEKHELLKKGHVRTDDLLITTRGNIGLVGIVPSDFDDANINAQLVLIRCQETKLNPRFLLWAMENPKIRQQFDYLQTGTALQQLPVGNLIQLEIPLPPLALQEEFARVVSRVEGLRARMAESARQAEGLFQNLLALSFTEGLAESFDGGR